MPKKASIGTKSYLQLRVAFRFNSSTLNSTIRTIVTEDDDVCWALRSVPVGSGIARGPRRGSQGMD
jgi:hypothetical protein